MEKSVSEKLKLLAELRNPSLKAARLMDEAMDKVMKQITVMKGDIGPMGPQGETGPMGPRGFDAVGIRGPKGDPGQDGKDGITPILGFHYWTSEDQSKIVNDVLSKIKIPKDGRDGINPNVDELVSKTIYELRKTPIDFKDITGTEKLIEFLKLGGFRGGGGSGTVSSSLLLQTDSVNNTLQTKLNLISGTNVTLVPDAFGGVTINATGGGGGGMTIGDPVVGGSKNQILFVDASLNLAQSGNLEWNDPIQSFEVIGIFNGNMGTAINATSNIVIRGDGNKMHLIPMGDIDSLNLTTAFGATIKDGTEFWFIADGAFNWNNNILPPGGSAAIYCPGGVAIITMGTNTSIRGVYDETLNALILDNPVKHT